MWWLDGLSLQIIFTRKKNLFATAKVFSPTTFLALEIQPTSQPLGRSIVAAANNTSQVKARWGGYLNQVRAVPC